MNQILEILIPILMLIESGHNPEAVGDNGQAIGILQIRPILVRDVNRILGETKYSLEDRWNPDRSIEMCEIYLNYYGKRILKENLTQAETLVAVGRLWNGGPNGDKKKSTLPYGKKILQALQAEKTSILNISI